MYNEAASYLASISLLLNYFLDNRTEKCWVLDRASNREVVSCAATGYGFAAWAIAAEKGVITKEEAVSWINQGIDNTIGINTRNRGWLYHFTDRSGNPTYNKEVSSVDTAIFWWGAKRAAEILDDPALQCKVKRHIESIDQEFMFHDGYFSHGFVWCGDKPAFFLSDWKEFSEGWLAYALFQKPYTPTAVRFDLPLFVYYYPISFVRDELILSYLKQAVKHQKRYRGGIGFTACDGPNGYRAEHKDVVSPLAVFTCEPLIGIQPEFFAQHGNDRALSAINLTKTWSSRDLIGIDAGACLLIHYSRTSGDPLPKDNLWEKSELPTSWKRP